MPNSAPFILDYQLSEEELVSFLTEGIARSRLYRWLWPHRRFVLGLFFLAIIITASSALGTRWWEHWQARLGAAALFGLAIFLFSVLDPLVTAWFIRPKVRSGRYASFLAPTRLELSETALRASDRASGVSAEWHAVIRVQGTKAGLVVYLPPRAALLVPRRAFDDQPAFLYFVNALNNLPRAKE